MNVTIKDVAKAAGVSVATVSRVLNNSAAVSEAAAEQVNNAVSELGYSPNFLGRNLRKCTTNVILAILPSTEQTFYSEIIRGMQSVAFEQGYNVLLSTSNCICSVEMSLLNMLANRTADAAVLFGSKLELDALKELNERHYIALCCERVENSGVLTVTVDDEAGAYDAVTNIIKKGHKKIAMISTAFKSSSSNDREKGYRKALKDNGILIREDYIYKGTYNYQDGETAFKYFMSLEAHPTAIFCISDLMAASTIKQAVHDGYTVGEDISVCGFDNIIMSSMFVPGITTIEQPCFKIGRTVVEKLIECMAMSKKSSEHIKLKHKLIERESVGYIK